MVGQWRVWGGGWPALYGSFMPYARARSHPPPATNISQPRHLIGLSPLPPSRSTDDSEVALGRRDKRKRPRGGEKRAKKKRERKRRNKKKKEKKEQMEQMERGGRLRAASPRSRPHTHDTPSHCPPSYYDPRNAKTCVVWLANTQNRDGSKSCRS